MHYFVSFLVLQLYLWEYNLLPNSNCICDAMWLKVSFASSSWCLQCAILAFTGDTHLVLQTLQLIRLLSIIRWLFCCVDSIVCRGGGSGVDCARSLFCYAVLFFLVVE